MLSRSNECRRLAADYRAAAASVSKARELDSALAHSLEATAAELESDDPLVEALREVVAALPTEVEPFLEPR